MTAISPSLILADRSRAPTCADLGLILLTGFCLLTAAVGRGVYLLQPFDSDAAMFIYMGKFVAEGGRWWLELRDNKLPTVGLLMSGLWRALGLNWAGYVLAGGVMSLLMVLLMVRTASRHLASGAGIATGLCALIYLNTSVGVFGGFQLETMQSLFALLAGLSAIECLRNPRGGDALVVGLCAGCAMLLKPTGLGVGAAFVLAVLFTRTLGWRQRLGLLVWAFNGLLIPLMVAVLYLAASQSIDDLPEMLMQTALYASQTPWRVGDWLKPVVVMVAVGFAILVRGWVSRRDGLDAPPGLGLIVGFLVAWFALEMLGAVMQGRMYSYHFFPVLAPAALLFGAIPRKARAASLAGALLPMAAISWLGAIDVARQAQPARSYSALVAHVIAHTDRWDSIWGPDVMRLCLESDRRCGSRFGLMFLFSNHDQAPLEYLPLLLDDLERNRPALVILPADLPGYVASQAVGWDQLARSPVRRANYLRAWSEIERYVQAHYTRGAMVDGQTLWLRR